MEQGAQATNSVPNKFRWSNGFSSAIVRHCAYLRSPEGRHFTCQLYFAGPMVSHRVLFDVAAIQEPGRVAFLVPNLFRWSNGFSSNWIRCRTCLRNSGDQHFSCQKYFAGPLVSHRPLFTDVATRSPGKQHFSCQKYFAGPMVSHRVGIRLHPRLRLFHF